MDGSPVLPEDLVGALVVPVEEDPFRDLVRQGRDGRRIKSEHPGWLQIEASSPDQGTA